MKEKFGFLVKNAILRQYKTASLRRAACRQKKNPDLPAGTQKTNKRHYSEMKSLSKIFRAMRYAKSSGRSKMLV